MTNVSLPDARCLSGLPEDCNILNLHCFVGRIRRLRRIRHEQCVRCQQSAPPVTRWLILMTNVSLPDARCLSGLPEDCNILNLHCFVGRIRRLRRIRHEQCVRCQQSAPPVTRWLILMTNVSLPDARCLSGLPEDCNILNLHCFVGRIRRLRRIRHEQCVRCQQSAPPVTPAVFCLWLLMNNFWRWNVNQLSA